MSAPTLEEIASCLRKRQEINDYLGFIYSSMENIKKAIPNLKADPLFSTYFPSESYSAYLDNVLAVIEVSATSFPKDPTAPQ